ncbi:Cobalt-zinc-cadmium resistance protein CzcA/ Cation efflux system protein CusA [Caballeronia sordidicola]|uniref:Cobalt-zinc-cadmium resistance protein CzcA/ Cation efflux system protein CusA n=2 Tax=Caballeronia sordidicola TaxID=196367 RepID=A0A242M5X5_CABSO|nr:Cobalt-zinc-cadmium resistance protein CzcA/ Cation efflux system protein CusA [Caballeronia sordidicola]
MALAIVIAGAIAFKQLPVASLPQVDFATITVAATLPGASPEVMASSVATPLERQFGHIAGVTQMTSSSTLGVTSVTLQFDLSRDVDGAARDVEAAINAARTDLPANLPSNPTYRKINSAIAPMMILSLTSDTADRGTLYDVASSVIEQKISQLEGVGQVQVVGSSLPAVRVDLNPTQLNSYGIGTQNVAQALSVQNSNRPKGQFSDGMTTADITANDQISKAKDFAPVIVGTSNGKVIHLSDVAHVYDSVQTLRSAGYVNGKPSVILLVFRLPNANVIDTVDRIKTQLPAIRASLPATDHLQLMLDTTTTIRSSVNDVELTLGLSVLLVIAVVFVFLRSPGATLIPGVAVGVSLIGTFAVMYLAGYTLDNLSLMALTVSTGFVVDDAIVVMENITRLIEQGVPTFRAALRGTQEVAFTVIAMSLSLIAVFVPILFMGGVPGRLFHEFAYTLATSVAISMVISLTVTPAMCAFLLKPTREEGHGRLYRASEAGFDAVLAGYRTTLGWAIRHPLIVVMSLVLTLVLNVVFAGKVSKGLFPQQDTGTIFGGFQGSQDASFQSMNKSLLAIQNVVRQDPAVENVAGFTGGQGGPGGGASNSGFVFITLKPRANRDATAAEVVDRLRPKLNALGGASTFLQAAQDIGVGGRQSNAQYQYQLSADTVDALSVWAPALYHQMQKMPQIKDVTTDQQNSGLQMLLNYDRVSAARFGITPQLIDNALYYEFGESHVSTIYTSLNQYYVVMEASQPLLRSPSTLNSTYVHSSGSSSVPLGAFSTSKPSTSPLSVNHSSFFPSVTISFNLAPNVSLGQATALIAEMQRRLGTPANIVTQFAGTAQAFQSSLASEPFLVLGAILAIYIVLGVLYESLIHPITILTTLPSASVGAMIALILFHSELDVISLIGIFLLIGIVKKNAILMIDFALQAERLEGKSTEEAIFEACMMRFRPILMTTVAAALGALPLALGHGTGSELRRPLGIAIVGGLIFSQILTLYTTPVIYLYFDRMSQRFHRRRRRGAASRYPAQP